MMLKNTLSLPACYKIHFIGRVQKPLIVFIASLILIFFMFPRPILAQSGFEIGEFIPFKNLKRGSIETMRENFTPFGMVLPSEKQIPGGVFDYEIAITNNSSDSMRYYYQVFFGLEKNDSQSPSDAHEKSRFYGICSESQQDFFRSAPVAPGKKTIINNVYRMVYPQGNAACGKNPLPLSLSHIRSDEAWMEDIRKKAEKNAIPAEKQLYCDAVWMLNRELEQKKDSIIHCPVLPEGKICFLLVVFAERDLDTLSASVNTCLKGIFLEGKNPFDCFPNIASEKLFWGISPLSIELKHGAVVLDMKGFSCPSLEDSLVIVKEKSPSNKKTIADDKVVLRGNKFYRNEKPFFPLTINYMVSMQTNGKDLWPCPIEYFHKNDGAFPLNHSSCRSNLIADMQLIRSMGFNSIRITTIGEIHKQKKNKRLFIKPCLTQAKDTVMFLGDNNNYTAYLKAVDELLDICYDAGLKVVFLMRNGIGDQEREKHLSRMTSVFSKHPGILAWDLFNEPLYFDTLFNQKPTIIKEVTRWQNLVKKNAPLHLTTIGMEGIREVFEWDPNLMPVDFISFHPYEYEPEQVRNEIYWYGKYINKPWVIGETSLPADNRKVSYQSQKSFAEKTLGQAIACGAAGYSWWQLKDVEWKTFHAMYMGLLQLNGLTRLENGLLVNGKVKPATKVFKAFSYNAYAGAECEWLPNYYNYSASEKPRLSTLQGKMVNEKNEGLEGGIIMAWNHEHTRMFHTITKKDGTFELLAPFRFVHWIASVSGYSTKEGWIEKDKSGKPLVKTLPVLRLSRIVQ